VVDAARQRGEIAVEVDPALDVQTRDLKECQTVLASTLAGWLTPKQQGVTRLSLESRGPDYSGTLRLAPREPLVTCNTVTNVRITDRAVEETIELDYNVQHAGIRQFAFLLPHWLKDARIQVPLLRQKTVALIRGSDQKTTSDPFIRVEITLQDAVSEKFRVMIQNDRLLSAAPQQAPIPVVETGRADRQSVVLENAGRDEVEVVRRPGLEPLGRQQPQWAELARELGGNITHAYLVTTPAASAGAAAGANRPQLVFQTRERKALETARARIGLAFTDLVLDDHGAYRAELTCHIDNSTEQYLEIELPEGATLWTARWRSSPRDPGTPVKPTFSEQKVPVTFSARRVRIPLVKTAPGELDYEVVLKYGGRISPVGRLASVEFPLVRVLRIPVDLSQVRLYLPETHDWFHFGGTMGQVEEADQAAGQVAYQTKVAGRLRKDLESSNLYTKARAANNIKQLDLAVQSLVSLRGDLAREGRGNAKFQEELERNESVRKEAQQAAEQIENAPQQEATVQDNRYRLNQRFLEQRAQVSGNEVKNAGQNWDESAGENEAAESSKAAQYYNPEWLHQKDLGKESGERSGKGLPADMKGRVLKGAGGKNKLQQFNELAGSQSQLLEPNAPSSEGRQMGGQAGGEGQKRYPVADLVIPVPQSSQSGVGGMGMGGGQAANPAQAAFQPPQRADTQQAKASRYQQEQLKQQLANPAQPYPVGGYGRMLPGGVGNGQMLPSAQPGQDQAGPQQGFGYFADNVEHIGKVLTAEGGVAPPAGAAGQSESAATAMGLLPFLAAGPPPGGLASLDVAIPRRGTPYFFSTPRGDAEITAQAVSGRLVGGLVQAVAIALAALAVWYLFAAARRGRFAWLASRRAATVLLALGVLGFCFFPGMAVLALLAGSGILVHNLLQQPPSPSGS
jgi:hypothetical protein